MSMLVSMPACVEVNQATQDLTGVNYKTVDQNKVMRKARQARDWNDTLAVVQYLQERNPFSNDPRLRNISTGVLAHPTHRQRRHSTLTWSCHTEVDGGENK